MLRRLSQRAEFWCIVVLAFGYPIAESAWALLQEPATGPIRITDADLWVTVGYELVVGMLILTILRLRGMPWAAWRPRLGQVETIHGIGLFFAAVMSMWLAYGLVSGFPGAADRLAARPVEGALGLVAIVAAALVNPVFGEAINLGYLQERLRGHGAATAIGAVLLVRLLTHAYEGPHAIVGVLPVGLVFGVYVWRTGRVWPAILAHLLLDLIGLLALRGG